jgi:hypothetical protein
MNNKMKLFGAVMFLLLLLGVVLPAVAFTSPDITTGLVGYWKFENNLRDETLNMNDGIPLNSISFVDGIYGRAIQTNNAWSAVNLGNSSVLQLTGNLTIAMWIRPNTDSCGTFLISKASSDYGEFTAVYSDYTCDNYIGLFRISDTRSVAGFPPVSSWTHVVFTSDDNATKIYFNGTLMYEGAAFTFPIASSTQLVYLGNLPAEAAYGHEIIFDEVMLYDRALTSVEVEYLAEANLSEVFHVPVENIANTTYSISSRFCRDNFTLSVNSTSSLCVYGNCTMSQSVVSESCVYGCDYINKVCKPSPLVSFIVLIIIIMVIGIVVVVIGKYI